MAPIIEQIPSNIPRGRVVRRDRILADGLRAWLIDELVRAGTWSRVLPEVYLSGPLPTGPAPLARLRVHSTALWAGTDYAVGGLAAAWWHGWLPTPPDVIEVHIGQSRRLSAQPGFWIRRTALDPLDVTEHRGIATTAAPRTALDLAARGSTDLLDAMLRNDWFDRAALWSALNRGIGGRGWVQARQALAECDFRPFSQAERRMHRGLRTAGVHGWEANPRLRIGSETVRPDLLFEEARLAVEIDGREYHSDPAAFERDRRKQNLLVGAGYRVLRFTWRQLIEDLDGIVRTILAELYRVVA